MFTPSLTGALAKFERMKSGERVVTNDETLDLLSDHFKEEESDDAALFFSEVASAPNPNRVGVLDQYVTWIGDRR